MDWAEARCTLVWQETGDPRRLLTLDMTPGTGLLRLRLIDSAWSEQAAAEAAGMPVSLDPGRIVAGTGAKPIRDSIGAGIEIGGIEGSALAGFGTARSIGVEGGRKSRLRLALPDAAAAVEALSECEEDALRRWGIDPAARASLARLPKPTGGDSLAWFRWQDYPKQAIRERASGTVVVRVDVDADGNPARCAVVASSGHAALDETTCASIMKRARFTPALDAGGNPVAFHYISRTVWRMP